MLKHNRYGYKVCYKEQYSKQYVRHFIAYTYSQAKLAKHGYLLYPQYSRLDNHILQNPKWKILPISKAEVLAGIWREDPF